MIIALIIVSVFLILASVCLIALSISKHYLEKENAQMRVSLSEARAKLAQDEDVINILTEYTKKKIRTSNGYKREQKDVNEYDVPQEARETESDN